MTVTDGPTTYNGWTVEAYHTGAGTADPIFDSTQASPAYLIGTNLQFDVGEFAFSLNALPSDTNYARWEPTTITSGYGSGSFVNNGSDGIQVDNEEHDGWILCEWYHGINTPQLFQMIKGFDDEPYKIPSSCARVLLFPVYF